MLYICPQYLPIDLFINIYIEIKMINKRKVKNHMEQPKLNKYLRQKYQTEQLLEITRNHHVNLIGFYEIELDGLKDQYSTPLGYFTSFINQSANKKQKILQNRCSLLVGYSNKQGNANLKQQTRKLIQVYVQKLRDQIKQYIHPQINDFTLLIQQNNSHYQEKHQKGSYFILTGKFCLPYHNKSMFVGKLNQKGGKFIPILTEINNQSELQQVSGAKIYNKILNNAKYCVKNTSQLPAYLLKLQQGLCTGFNNIRFIVSTEKKQKFEGIIANFYGQYNIETRIVEVSNHARQIGLLCLRKTLFDEEKEISFYKQNSSLFSVSRKGTKKIKINESYHKQFLKRIWRREVRLKERITFECQRSEILNAEIYTFESLKIAVGLFYQQLADIISSKHFDITKIESVFV